MKTTQQEFISLYGNELLEKNKEGYDVGAKSFYAIPCGCDYKNCQGWKMQSGESLGFEKYLEIMAQYKREQLNDGKSDE